jgi:hypothetical protein
LLHQRCCGQKRVIGVMRNRRMAPRPRRVMKNLSAAP